MRSSCSACCRKSDSRSGLGLASGEGSLYAATVCTRQGGEQVCGWRVCLAGRGAGTRQGKAATLGSRRARGRRAGTGGGGGGGGGGHARCLRLASVLLLTDAPIGLGRRERHRRSRLELTPSRQLAAGPPALRWHVRRAGWPCRQVVRGKERGSSRVATELSGRRVVERRCAFAAAQNVHQHTSVPPFTCARLLYPSSPLCLFKLVEPDSNVTAM